LNNAACVFDDSNDRLNIMNSISFLDDLECTFHFRHDDDARHQIRRGVEQKNIIKVAGEPFSEPSFTFVRQPTSCELRIQYTPLSF
jgi:hypothetical protein